MRKLSLRIDDLAVETFRTEAEAEPAGTVVGHQRWTYSCEESECGSCYTQCGTCELNSCEPCRDTIDVTC